MKTKKIMLILSIVFVFLLIIGSASAADDIKVNQTDSIGDEVLTSDNDVDLVSTEDNDENTDVLTDDNTVGSFSELEQYINDNKGYEKTVYLNKDYTFNNETDSNYNIGGIYLSTFVNIDGQGHTIDAKGTQYIFNTIGKQITLKNIVFKNTNNSAIKVDSSDVNIFDCTFDNNNDRAIRITVSALNCIVDSCTFINGQGILINAYETVISNSIFKNNSATNGGAINVNSNNSRIINCIFTDNIAENGGAIYFSFVSPEDVNETNAVLYITGSRFEGNKANTGGAIDNHRSKSPNTDDKKYLIEGNEVIISHSTFGDNYAVNNPQIFGKYTSDNTIGQGIFLEPLSELFINLKDNSIVNINQDYTLQAGPILITANNVTINGNNHIIDANGFSAIKFMPTLHYGRIIINNLTIKNSNGSALYLYSGHTMGSINYCNFINNSADNGGSIYIYIR